MSARKTTPAAAPQAAAPAREPIAVLIVTPHADGYRRAGRAWTREPTRVARDALSDEQLQALQDDPLIDLQVVEAV
jgi:hypothetical protein